MAVLLGLLGGFAVRRDDAVAMDGRWRPAKAAAILKILALQRNRSIQRDQLIELLWPAMDAESGANNLYKNLHQLRDALAGAGISRDVIRLDRGLLSLDPAVVIDVELFREAARLARSASDEASLRAAVELYGGELLPDDRYEDWAAAAREDAAALALDLRLRFASLLQDESRHEDAIEQYRAALEIDRAAEDAHAGLMRCFASSGRRDVALRQYERCVEVLAAELSAEPSGETQALAAEIRHAALSQAAVEDAVEAVTREAEAAARKREWHQAIALFREAIARLQESGADDEREARLWLRLAGVSTPVVTNAELAEFCRRAVDLACRAGSFETRWRAVVRFQDATDNVPNNHAGHREAVELIEAALRDAPDGDSAGKAALLAASGRPRAAAQQPGEAQHETGRGSVVGERDPAIEERLREAVAMARRTGDRTVLSYALVRFRTYITSPDTLEERLAATRELNEVATGPRPTRWAYMAHLFRQEDLLESGDIDGARIEARSMRRLGESARSDAILAIAGSMQATHEIADGSLIEATRVLFESRGLDERIGLNSNADQRFLVQLLMLRWHEGRIGEVEEDFRRIKVNNPSYTGLWAPLALVYAETGRIDDAKRIVSDILRGGTVADVPKDHMWWLTMVCLSYAAVATGDLERAREIYTCVGAYGERNASTWSAISFGAASLILARVGALLGEPDVAKHFEHAVAFNLRTHQRVWVARARYEFALYLRSSGDVRGREFAQAALRDAVEVGMARLKEQCEGFLFEESAAPVMPEVRYATTADGVRIAYTDEGEGRPLVHMSQIPWNHLQLELEMPEWRAWHEALGAGRRYIRYDGRGRGLSDREGHTLAVEKEVLDLEAVVDELGLEQFDLYSGFQTSMTALTYAARHPERVRKLALWNAYASSAEVMDTAQAVSGRAMAQMDYETYAEFSGDVTVGYDHPETARCMAKILLNSADLDFVRTWFSETYLVEDARWALAAVRCPVLVVENRAFPIDHDASRAARGVAEALRRVEMYVRDTPVFAPFMEDLDENIKAIRGFFDAPTTDASAGLAAGGES